MMNNQRKQKTNKFLLHQRDDFSVINFALRDLYLQ